MRDWIRVIPKPVSRFQVSRKSELEPGWPSLLRARPPCPHPGLEQAARLKQRFSIIEPHEKAPAIKTTMAALKTMEGSIGGSFERYEAPLDELVRFDLELFSKLEDKGLSGFYFDQLREKRMLGWKLKRVNKSLDDFKTLQEEIALYNAGVQ